MIRTRRPLPPLACAYQEQYCFPNEIEENRCMPLNTSEASDDAQDRAPSEQLLSTIRWLRQTELTGRNPTNAIFTMRNQALKSRSGLFGGSQSGISDKQWQIDTQYWFAIWLAYLQQMFVDIPSGNLPDNPSFQYSPTDEQRTSFCQN